MKEMSEAAFEDTQSGRVRQACGEQQSGRAGQACGELQSGKGEQACESKRNFQKELDRMLQTIPVGEHTLLLHSCCAPCSSYCMEYLREYFRITVFFFNPNITEREEYEKRVAEEKRLIAAYNSQVADGCYTGMLSTDRAQRIEILEGRYCPQDFYEMAKGYEQCREGGERCMRCYELRLKETAKTAAEGGFNFFTTTLSISPLKNAAALNKIGGVLSEKYGVPYLYSDFKKKNGYKRSVELSAQFGLYRQDYCGCAYSKAERERLKGNRGDGI